MTQIKNKQKLIFLSLVILLLIQFFSIYDKFSIPFYNTSLTVNYDNLNFLKKSYDGNFNGDLKSNFGITENFYIDNSKGEKIAISDYYTHHPFLVKAIFQQYTKIFGYREWVSRSFYFIINYIIVVGLFFIIYLLTESILLSFLSSFFLISIPLFMSFQGTIKYETDGILFMVLSFLSLIIYIKNIDKLAYKILFGIITFLLFFSHWPSYIYYLVIFIYLLYRGYFEKSSDYKKIFKTFFVYGIFGLISYFLLVVYIKGGFRLFYNDISQAFLFRGNMNIYHEKISFLKYFDKQISYIQINYTYTLFLIFIAILSFNIINIRKIYKKISEKNKLLILFFISTIIPAIFWQFMFIQGSFTHDYWQYYFNIPIVITFLLFFIYLKKVYKLKHSKKYIYISIILVGILYIHSLNYYNDLIKGKNEKIIDYNSYFKGGKNN